MSYDKNTFPLESTGSTSDTAARSAFKIEILLKLEEITIIGIIPHPNHLMQAINSVRTPLFTDLESIQVWIYGRLRKKPGCVCDLRRAQLDGEGMHPA